MYHYKSNKHISCVNDIDIIRIAKDMHFYEVEIYKITITFFSFVVSINFPDKICVLALCVTKFICESFA